MLGDGVLEVAGSLSEVPQGGVGAVAGGLVVDVGESGDESLAVLGEQGGLGVVGVGCDGVELVEAGGEGGSLVLESSLGGEGVGVGHAFVELVEGGVLRGVCADGA